MASDRRVVNTRTFCRLAKASERYNRGPSDELLRALDPQGNHIITLELPPNDGGYIRSRCLVAVKDGEFISQRDECGGVYTTIDIADEQFDRLPTAQSVVDRLIMGKEIDAKGSLRGGQQRT